MSVKLKDIFEIEYGNSLTFGDMNEIENGIPFVSRTEKNNGICGFVEEIDSIKLNPANTISVAVGGSVLESFLQKEPYYTGYHILILHPKQNFTDNELLFYCMSIKSNAFRYSFGRQANKTLKDILLPSKNEIPAWVYETNIKEQLKESILNENIELNIENWKSFNLFDLFKIKGSKSIVYRDVKKYGDGKYPYVVTASKNNGVRGFFDYWTEEGNVLTIDSATVGSCFYQKEKFSASDHVEKLIPNFNMNSYIATFLTTVINLEQYRYGYGRKFAQKRIKETVIKLPAKENGEPDFEFMENYIKSLPYSKNLE